MISEQQIQVLKRDALRPNYGSRYASLAQLLAVIEAYEAIAAELVQLKRQLGMVSVQPIDPSNVRTRNPTWRLTRAAGWVMISEKCERETIVSRGVEKPLYNLITIRYNSGTVLLANNPSSVGRLPA